MDDELTEVLKVLGHLVNLRYSLKGKEYDELGLEYLQSLRDEVQMKIDEIDTLWSVDNESDRALQQENQVKGE